MPLDLLKGLRIVQKSNVTNRSQTGEAPVVPSAPAANTISTHYGSCAWTPRKGFVAWTKQGEVEMFENGGQRAVELFLTSVASCLTFFLAEHVKSNGLPVTSLRVSCDGRVVPDPERLGSVTTRVTIEGTISREDRLQLLAICDKQWKVMNSIRQPPVCETLLVTPAGEIIS